jgi:flagellar assembly factor FliW
MTIAAVATSDTASIPQVAVDSLVLGQLHVPSSAVFHFSGGLHGFETLFEFALVPAAREGLFWLQSLANREVAFLLIDPFLSSPGFEVDLGLTELAALQLESPSDALVLAIVTLPAGSAELPTANFRGPIVLNPTKQIAGQVVSAVAGHEVRTPVDLHALPVRGE